MTLTPREQIASATMIATHELVSNLTRAKSAMENLVHEMGDLTALITTEGRVIWGNHTTSSWLQVDPDLLHEAHLSRLFPEDSWDEFYKKMKSLSSETALEFTMMIKGQDGPLDILWKVKPFRSVSARRGSLLLLTGHNVTEILATRSEKAKLEAELETAQILQNRFLPASHVVTNGLEISSFYRPAEQCSGDWWGHFDLAADCELVCIADVTGHGAASALVTAMTQALCLSFVDRHQGQEVSPAALIREINDIVFRTFQGDMYMTFFAIVFDHSSQKARASNAAHNFPMVLRAIQPEKPEGVLVQGNPIGHAGGTEFVDIEFGFAKGDRFILYTDGLTECRNPQGKLYGAGAFRRSIIRNSRESNQGFRDKIMGEALSFYSGQPLADDVTLAIIDIKS